jgi:hypothetical protein
MAMGRDEVERKWQALLQGRLSRDDVATWAAEMENEPPPNDMMVAVGLQNLANLDLRTWPDGSSRPEARVGEYMESIERVTEKFEGWKASCIAYDADPNGSVYFSEDADYSDDFRDTHWRGTFSGSWQGEGFLSSPANLSADEAIAWGRARSSRVFMRTRDGFYTAGSAPTQDAPWPENLDLSPRTDREEGLEWMDRTEDDDPIEWDVKVSPYVSPHTTTDAFLLQFHLVLEADPGINLKSIVRPPDHPEAPGNPVAVIRVVAPTQNTAQQMASKLVLPLFSKALRETVHLGSFGWTMGVNASPAEQ